MLAPRAAAAASRCIAKPPASLLTARFSSGPGGDDRSVGDKMKDAAGEATGADAAHPSVLEKLREGVGKMTEKVGEMFEESGSVGRQFTPEGRAGGTAQKIGGPLDKEGQVGKEFTTNGSIGGTVQQAAEKVDRQGEEMQQKAQQNQGKEQMKQGTDNRGM